MKRLSPPGLAVVLMFLSAAALGAADSGFVPDESLNIGAVRHQGSVNFDGTVHRINGSGAEVFGTEDSFFFTFKGMTGDASITAHLTEGLQFVDPWAKAGVMIRASREADAPNVFFAVTSLNGLVLQNRDTAGSATNMRQFPGQFSTAAGGKGLWLRLVRQGDTITAFRSEDGQAWEEAGSFSSVQLEDEALFGIGMSTHDENQQFGFSSFENVSIVEGVPAS